MKISRTLIFLSVYILSIISFIGLSQAKSESISIAFFDLHFEASTKQNWQPKVVKKKKGERSKLTKLSLQEIIKESNQKMYDGLRSRLTRQKRFNLVSPETRQVLLDPAWNTAPTSLEESLEIGREMGVDWIIQGDFKEIGERSFKISLYLLALSPQQWLINRSKVNAEAHKDVQSKLVDFNMLAAPPLVLAEHIIWASRQEQLDEQLAKVGLRLLLKADQELARRRNQSRQPVVEEEVKEDETKEEPKKLSRKEQIAKELSDAARKELDDIQARLDAEHQRRLDEKKIKKITLAREASEAWQEIERISDGTGLVTISVDTTPTTTLSFRQRRKSNRKGQSVRPVIKAALSTWKQIQAATQNVLNLSAEDHRSILLNFIRDYSMLDNYQAQVSEARNRYTWINRTTIEWIPVRSGRFQVGSSLPIEDERPMQWIEISAFEVSVSEVTNAQYKQCVDAKVCTPPHWDDKSCEIFTDLNLKNDVLPAQMRRGDMPVVCVDWNQAQTFARWAGGRLLSETEWEFIARSSEKSFVYPWGQTAADCSKAVMHTGAKSGCGFGVPWPVCSKLSGASHIGLCDLAGNVWEWVADQYRPNHEKVPADGKPFLGGGRKVIKGGSFSSNSEELYASTRGQLGPRGRSNSVGFRIARAEQEAR